MDVKAHIVSAATNWKTTAAGLATIFTALGSIFAHMAEGDYLGAVTQADLLDMIAGVGLIFAADHDHDKK